MNTYSSRLVVLALCSASLLACNSNNGGGGANNSTVTPAGFGTGGATDTTGTGGTTFTSGSGGAGATPAVGCGGIVCPDPLSVLPAQIAKLIPPEMKPVACCDAATAKCGTATTSGACVPTPPPDPRCPDTISGTVNAPTCCQGATNTCGYYVSASMPCTVFAIPSLAHELCAAAGTGGTTAIGSGGTTAMDTDGGM